MIFFRNLSRALLIALLMSFCLPVDAVAKSKSKDSYSSEEYKKGKKKYDKYCGCGRGSKHHKKYCKYNNKPENIKFCDLYPIAVFH